MVLYTGWGKSRFTVVCMENNSYIVIQNKLFYILTIANLLLLHPYILSAQHKVGHGVATEKSFVE